MSDPRYLRASSPPRRFAGHPSRNSTSTLDLHPTYDRYGNPISSRDSLSGAASSSERLAPRPPAPPRIYRDPVPIRSGRPGDHDHSHRRLEPIKRPLSVNPPANSSTYRPALSADKSPQHYSKPWARGDDESYYIQPNTSSRRDASHSRHPSLDVRSKLDPYYSQSRGDRTYERGGYLRHGGAGARQAPYREIPQIRPPRDKNDRDYGYEYTDFKEQAYRDTAPRTRPRRTSDLGTRERPHSITGIEDIAQRGRPARDGYAEKGPPVSTRGFSKIDHNGAVRHEYRYPREPDSGRSGDESEGPSRRRVARPTVSLHQDRPEGYTSNTEDRGPEKHRNRHRAGSVEQSSRPRGDSIDRSLRPRGESRDRTTRRRGESFDRGSADDRARYANQGEDARRDKYRERRHDSVRADSEDRRGHHHHKQRDPSQDRYKPDAARRDRPEDYDKRRDDGKGEKSDSHFGTGAALGAAGAAAAGLFGAKHRYDKEKEKDKAGSEASSNSRDMKPSQAPDPSDKSTDSNSDEERRERRRRRRLEKEQKDREMAAAAVAAGSKDKLAPPNMEASRSMSRDRGGHYPPEKADDDEDRRSRRHSRRQAERRHSSSDTDSDDEISRQRQVRVVSPAKQPEVKPKGILRPPREKFPEDPAPVREGVAPLKDAGKKGIPPNARWTKIDRMLVNPEALEMGNERFEERQDYVIVLRVLSREEIEQYAAKTAELREARNKQYRLEAPRHDESYDEYEDEKPPPKAIEPPMHHSSESLLPRDRLDPYNQFPPPNMTASAPTLAPTTNDDDPNRPSLYPSNSYHRMAPQASANPPPPAQNTTVYPPPPTQQQSQQQQQPPSGQYSAQQPVTGEYNTSGYPVVPPPSQPVYQPPYQAGAPLPGVGGPQAMPWQQQGSTSQAEGEPVPVPVPR